MLKEKKIRECFDKWYIYEKVIANNYMAHHEIFEAIRSFLNTKKPISILDLGCGDATHISKALKDTNIKKYWGLDFSDVALKKAEGNLKLCPFEIKLIRGDFETTLDNVEQNLDLILAGFSLHHLHRQEKISLLKRCRNKLNENGNILIYDLVKKENETREGFISRYVDYCTEFWNLLNEQELKAMHDHIIGNDFPEPFHFYQDVEKSIGFSKVTSLFKDKSSFHWLIRLEK